jgi:exodeoxyribonuclease-5
MEKLVEEQKTVLYHIVNGIKRGKQQISLGGFAGVGKSTLIKYLIKFFPGFKVCAYTGKAANVLRKKGISASTIHSLIYKPVIEDGVLVGFDLASDLEADGIIVDEASMVSKDIYEDLKYFRLPIIFVGDHGQLEPIGTDFNLMKSPDLRLEQIHRNANEIAKFAQHLRMGYVARAFRPKTDKVVFLNSWSVTPQNMINVDQIICAFNKTRVGINVQIRKTLGFDGLLNVNEKIICLKNNNELMLFNGMQGTVRSLYKKRGSDRLDFEFDERIYPALKYSKKFFNEERPNLENYSKTDPIPFDYAYAITCHKAQGDEWDKVMVYEQKSAMWDHRRWTYTAASRAADQLFWVI